MGFKLNLEIVKKSFISVYYTLNRPKPIFYKDIKQTSWTKIFMKALKVIRVSKCHQPGGFKPLANLYRLTSWVSLPADGQWYLKKQIKCNIQPISLRLGRMSATWGMARLWKNIYYYHFQWNNKELSKNHTKYQL